MSRILGDNSAMDEEQEVERSSYYGGASVPFIWESRPGTPKNHLFSDSSLPQPLTPPPSYYSSSGILSTPKRQSKVRTKLSKFLSMTMFNDLRKSSNKKNVYGSSFSWSSTSSSSSFSSSPTSTLCYSNGERKGCCSSMGSLKRALFSGSMESLRRHGSTGKALIISDMNKA